MNISNARCSLTVFFSRTLRQEFSYDLIVFQTFSFVENNLARMKPKILNRQRQAFSMRPESGGFLSSVALAKEDCFRLRYGATSPPSSDFGDKPILFSPFPSDSAPQNRRTHSAPDFSLVVKSLVSSLRPEAVCKHLPSQHGIREERLPPSLLEEELWRTDERLNSKG